MAWSTQSPPRKAYANLYKLKRWRQLRAYQLQREPLCQNCLRSGFIKEAEVVDHIKPHKGNRGLFFKKSNLRSLCWSCHSATKQQEENNGYASGADENGDPFINSHWDK